MKKRAARHEKWSSYAISVTRSERDDRGTRRRNRVPVMSDLRVK